ncbi:bifunctional UDP-N-acetylmuramoyl-tripeptide:D-alanyl-D-alanine ligase/alanine racemase [Pedobacter sp. Du54]|uniref:bifunctional UDP-N-acetylmuramoyl-tripeptide:D-alanyl-D-alanine ligase/alanine racemase n=1 Tax=Pedobacter anseongensis TaxID=3133439 RepID=UPI0030965198
MSSNSYSINHIAKILAANAILPHQDAVIQNLLTDSRTVVDADRSLFFAISAQRNGHDFIGNAYENGIRNFVVSAKIDVKKYSDANFLNVDNTLIALQELTAYHRKQHHLPVIGITGSNGKTIVKEWLFQLLSTDYHIVRSPKSFNSQIGVPLSIWRITDEDNLGIFEAGISKANEMNALAEIIKPTIGILTNIGEAHAEGFNSKEDKLREKLKLFKNVDLLIYAPEYAAGVELPGKKKFSWSTVGPADLQITSITTKEENTVLHAIYHQKKIGCEISFNDKASIENCIICWATLLALGYTPEAAELGLTKLTRVNMRLALINGIENCSIIDDSYSADSSSLAIALDFLNLQNQHPKKTLILSDLYETGKKDEELYTEIAALLQQKQIDRLIGIGVKLSSMAHLFSLEASFYRSTQAFIDNLSSIPFANETILIKGARRFEFERITKVLTLKIHDTILEINLNSLAGNLQFYRNKLNHGVKIMAMVKAFSYGSGSFEIANLLQYQKVDYLAVAYADEGIALRKAGITLPIMVMSPEPSAFEAIINYKLEPEIYSVSILKSFIHFLPENETTFKVHLKLDTGMHRLGFEKTDLPQLFELLLNTNKLMVETIFTHLVATEQARHDEFTNLQINEFSSLYSEITKQLNYFPIRHVLNTSGITRWPQAQFDMVRIGIGLYGFDAALSHNKGLQTVALLKTTVTQVKDLKPGETVGYGRSGVLPNGGKIATVKIGYADGYNRKFGNGVGKMLINGKMAPTIGAICMDMCMLDVTNLTVKTGDEVVVFDHRHSIVDLAKEIDTIPYEILTNVSQRVKRVYFYE